MRMFTKSAVAAVAATGLGLLAAPVAQATPTYTQNFSNYSCAAGSCTGTDTTGSQSTDYLATFNIPKFDTSLGTLTNMVISVTPTNGISATASIKNSGGTDATSVFITQESLITTTASAAVGATTVTGGSNGGDSNLSFTGLANPGVSVGTIAAGATVNGINLSGNFAASPTMSFSGIDPNLEALGGGTFGITFATGEYTTLGSSGGNLSASVATSDNINMSVQYTYTNPPPPPVPEPASLALLGAGLAGLGAVRRRRAARKA